MFISGVEPVKSKHYFGGTFGDVYTSVYQGKPVALKMLRTFQAQVDRSKIYKVIIRFLCLRVCQSLMNVLKRFCKEALIWQKLEHEFVLPFLGIDAENFPRQPCMVSPWMVNGTLVQFLKKNPKCNLDRMVCCLSAPLSLIPQYILSFSSITLYKVLTTSIHKG